MAFSDALVAIRYSHERSELRPSKRGRPAPGAQQGVLQGVLGVVDRAEHAVAVGVQRAAVGLDEAPVGVLVAAAGGIEEVALERGDGCGGGGHRYWYDRRRASKSSDR